MITAIYRNKDSVIMSIGTRTFVFKHNLAIERNQIVPAQFGDAASEAIEVAVGLGSLSTRRKRITNVS